jgi:hypothetical protein
MEDLIFTITSLVIFMLGVVTGIYWSSQIEKDIKNRTNNDNKNN